MNSNRKSNREDGMDIFHVATRLTHGGRDPKKQFGFINTPVYRGSTVLYPTIASLKKNDVPYVYGRRGTPNTADFTQLVSELDGAAGTVVTPSGLCAITTAILSCVASGDHILITDSVYGAARAFCDVILKRMNVRVEYYDPLIGTEIATLMRQDTKLIYVETPGSQTMEMQDIPAIAAAAHERGAIVLADNSWGTPLFFNALEKGVDLCVHAATKYMVGHSDAMLGVVSANANRWPALYDTHRALGIHAGPDDLFLGLRGLRTMGIRLEHQSRVGLEMAAWFRDRPEVAQTLHPALPGAPGHEIWKRDFTGAASLFSVILHPVSEDALSAMVDHLELFGIGYSWGGFESLVLPFDPRTHRTATQWTANGPALRFYIGLEDPDDLKADLQRGFERLNQANKRTPEPGK